MSARAITSTDVFVRKVCNDYAKWNTATLPWFRGEPASDTPLLPKLYRLKPDGTKHDENQLIQFFRMKAPTFGVEPLPQRGAIDQWLFLMQHVGLPTRLLDWTEGALVALYFALLAENPIVWMLNPVGLNRLSLPDGTIMKDNEFPLTWIRPNIGEDNIRAAWELDNTRLDLPIAIHPTNIHPRMSAQKSCFTVHGKKKEPLTNLVPKKLFQKYEIDNAKRKEMLRELRILGISHLSLFPDLDGLAADLQSLF